MEDLAESLGCPVFWMETKQLNATYMNISNIFIEFILKVHLCKILTECSSQNAVIL